MCRKKRKAVIALKLKEDTETSEVPNSQRNMMPKLLSYSTLEEIRMTGKILII